MQWIEEAQNVKHKVHRNEPERSVREDMECFTTC